MKATITVARARDLPKPGRAAGEAFDGLAARYDEDFTDSQIGRLQREAVWRELDLLFQPGQRVLDLGCGTGADAIHLARRGLQVHAIDASQRMIAEARAKIAADRLVDHITTEILAIEEWDRQDCLSYFDGALSDFGALNCVQHLRPVAVVLSRLIRPGGALALCLISRFCLWETAYFGIQGRFAKAARRWSHGGQTIARFNGSNSFPVYYRSVREIIKAFQPEFRLDRRFGIGIFVPPTYLEQQARRVPGLLRLAAKSDRKVAAWPAFRAVADHALLVFTREKTP